MSLKNVEILGFRGNIVSINDTLNEVNSFKKDGEIIQLLNADAIASSKHIIHGVNQAFLAFQRGENLAKDFSVEIVLRCSAQRQISRAFELLGLNEGQMNLCAVLINCESDYRDELSSMFTYDEEVLKSNDDYMVKIFDIGDVELSNFTVEEIILDKISKLTVDY
ncbi:MAG: hypothetical protein IKF11_02460 [Methanobrevibacter sp.]|nr:hypothetical protein [Methanobrevibacter sp.]